MTANPTIPMTLERLLMLAHCQVMSINRRALRPLQRTLEGNSAIADEMSRSGGFESIIESNVLTPSAQSVLNQLCQVQDTILTSDRFSNEARSIPTVQEETSNIGNIINVVTGIKEHLDDCCEEVKLLLRDLKIQVRDVYRGLKSLIIKSTQLIIIDVRTFKNLLLSFYNLEKAKLIAFLPDLKAEIYAEIRSIIRDENRELLHKLDALNEELRRVNTTINKVHDIVKHTEKLVIAFGLDWADYRKTYHDNHNKIVKDLGAVVGALTSEIIEAYAKSTSYTKRRTRMVTRTINHNVDGKFRDLDEFLKDEKKGLPFIMTAEVCANIVGESYAKWDSISMYYPTLVFVFNEITSNNKPRRSQVKLRFNKTSADVSEQDLKDIITRVKAQPTIKYIYGPVKGNYVSKDKRFKTTIFGQNKEVIGELLNSLFKVIPENFDKELLSITDIGRKRPSITKRRIALNNVKLNSANYDETFTMQLKSVNILINGINKIIKLV